MEKIKKPHFEFSVLDKISALFGIFGGIFGYINLPWYATTIGLLILFVVLSILNFLKYKNQVDLLFGEYNTIYDNHMALSSQFKDKNKQVAKQKDLIYEYDFMLNNIMNTVTLKMINTSPTENEFLANFNKILLQDKEYLYQLKKGEIEK